MHIWHSHTLRYDNVIKHDFVFYHCSLKGQNDLLWIILVQYCNVHVEWPRPAWTYDEANQFSPQEETLGP